MGKEMLVIPEQCVGDVVKVLKAGLNLVSDEIGRDVAFNLAEWCNEMEENDGE